MVKEKKNTEAYGRSGVIDGKMINLFFYCCNKEHISLNSIIEMKVNNLNKK